MKLVVFVVIVGLMTSHVEATRFAVHPFDLHGNGIFGRRLRLESRDATTVDVTISLAGVWSRNVTLRSHVTSDHLLLPLSPLATASRQNNIRGLEISSDGSIDAYVILADDVTVRLLPTSQLGCAYRVTPSLPPDPNSPRHPPVVEIYVVATEDNTSVAIETTDNETTPTTTTTTTSTTVNSFETFSARTRLSAEEGFRIFSTKPVAVFTMEYGLEGGNADGNTSVKFPGILTVMQAVPLTLWPTGYRLSCSDCDNLSIDAAIFGAGACSVNVKTIDAKGRTDHRLINGPFQTLRLNLALDKSPTSIEADDRILLLIYYSSSSGSSSTDGSKMRGKEEVNNSSIHLVVQDLGAGAPALVLISSCSQGGLGAAGRDGICAVDTRESIAFESWKNEETKGGERIVNYQYNYRSVQGTQLDPEEKNLNRATFERTPPVTVDAIQRNPYQGGIQTGRNQSKSYLREVGGGDETAAYNTTVLTRGNGFTDQTVKIAPKKVETSVIRLGDLSTTFSSKITPNSNFPTTPTSKRDMYTLIGEDGITVAASKEDPIRPSGKRITVTSTARSSKTPTQSRIEASAITYKIKTATWTPLPTYKPPNRERKQEMKTVGRRNENYQKSASNASKTITYKAINPRANEIHPNVHRSLSIHVLQQEVTGKAGSSKVVGYFEIEAREVGLTHVGLSPTVIAVVASLCGAVFFVVVCILGFVIIEICCSKGKLQRSRISPFIEITNSGY